MRRIARIILCLLGSGAVSPLAAQNPQPIVPATRIVPATPGLKPRDIGKLPAAAQPIFRSAHRGMDWLRLANKPDGRFVYGFLPSLRLPMDGDNFISQAGAAFALARASRYFRDERAAAVARQAILTLLLETTVDPRDPIIRYTAAPPQTVNRLASHGLLILAIHELGSPSKDLLDQADQLCNALRKLQRDDGSLMSREGDDSRRETGDQHAHAAGIALHALARSHKVRPAEWKLATLRKARAFYVPAWQNGKNLWTVVTHSAAYAEAYLATKEQAFADSVFTMNDWLIGLQYPEDPGSARKHWYGGFPRCEPGMSESGVPDVTSARPAESLADACRVARHAGDLTRGRHYEKAILLDLQFVMSLQYTDRKAEHFVETFRPAVLGGFHASHQDGNLRIDYTQHAVCAMVQYLDGVFE